MTKKVEVLQEDKYDCAAASLLSLIKYYGGNMCIEDVRRLINTTKMGTNAYDLISGAKMLGIALLIMAVAVLIIFFGSRLAAKLAKTLREKVFNRVIHFSKSEMKEFGTSSLITRTTNDIQQIQQVVVMLMRVVFYAPIIAIGGILKTTSAENSMLWIIIIAVAALLIIVGTLFIIVMPKFKIFQSLVDKLNFFII